ncbi:hypothetical protein [Paraliomyxa miuraensis]|uniref:hypothetical protein n=1 Tax=Paraliomyxa miuraensis TaxID=376150 RepID=UPI00225BD189|nr:hypothetical protein [Paraliomyxa miuraensis]MCX4239848.1 hypothetical protein [Paraliomyxa miuraensis]
MSAEAKAGDPPSRSSSRRSELLLWLGSGVAVTVVMVGLVIWFGGRLEAATWGLVVAAGAMAFALRSLYRMANALSQPAVAVALVQEDVAAYAGVRELREERRRLLRAINELQFDFEMGKLSEEDYRKVREGYELQAVEVIRALDSERSLHPGLREELQRRGLLTNDEPEAKAEPEGEAKAEPEGEAKAEPEGEAKAEPETKAKAEPETKADPEMQADPEAKANDAEPEEAKA